MLSSKEKKRECSSCFTDMMVYENSMNILDIRAKAVSICLQFYVNKTSVSAALLLAFECQLHLTGEDDILTFPPKGRSLCVRSA